MLPRFFIDRPIFAWVIAILIMLAGGIALTRLPVALYPGVAPPMLSIDITYPGASPEVVETSAVQLIEQELNGIEHLVSMESTSEVGRASISLAFEPGTNLDYAAVETDNRIKRAEPRLPDEVRRQGLKVYRSTRNSLLFLAFKSTDPTMDATALGAYVSGNVIEHVRRVKGVGEAGLYGSDYSMRIWLQPDRLYAYGITPGDVTNAIKAQNIQLATGELGQHPALPGQQINAPIVAKGRLSSVEEFNQIIVRAQPDGALVLLKDVARVELGAQSYDVKGFHSGQPAAYIGIKLTPDGNALETKRLVTEKMEELANSFPEHMTWLASYDSTPFISLSITEVVHTLLIAMALVVLVMYLFMENLRATLIPTIVVPVALLGAILGLYVLGYSINLLTLFAMVLAIGIVVDDAIVVVENVERIMTEEGLPPREATRKAMDQIYGAVIGITVVLSAVFLPMIFMSGSVGVVYRQFAATLLLSMGFSAFVALSLTPALCATLLKHEPGQAVLPTTGVFGYFNRGFARVTNAYHARVGKNLSRPMRALVVYAILLGALVLLFLRLPGGFLPEEDQGMFITEIILPSGASQERTLALFKEVDDFMLAQPEVDQTVGLAGWSIFANGQNMGHFFVRLKPWGERIGEAHSNKALVDRVNKHFAGHKSGMVIAIPLPAISELAIAGGFDFRLQDRAGQGREKLTQMRNMILAEAAKNPLLAGVRPEGQEPGPQLSLEVDRAKARALSVDLADLNQTLQSALGSAYVNDFIRDGRVLKVQMQGDAALRGRPEDILQLPVKNTRGGLIPLSEIAQLRWTQGPRKLDRFNGVPSMKIAGAAAAGHSTGEAMQVMESIAAQLPAGFGHTWTGTAREEKVSADQAPFLFALSLIVVFLALAALYESWSIPFAVMLVVPLGIFGAVLAVTLRGMPNDVYFKVGMIATIGLSAKNAILIIEFARELHDQGKDLVASILEACRLRFRPILMTSIAFVCGVLPLVFSSGAGAQSRHSIGTGVAGGMIAATVFAVFMVPVFFLVVRRIFPGHGRHHHEKESSHG
ncbi:MAG: multidrug efflux RND transporter permease subunit [Rhodocyclaceae bacterium]|jgi:multidrug efflux pump|nr:multidrug efflux RND transporter permease subunit [Rhodocyclaceae bacterium]